MAAQLGRSAKKRGSAPVSFTLGSLSPDLDNEETIAAYLTAALEDPDPDEFLVAVKTVARARGMTQQVKDSGWGAKAYTRRSHPARSRVIRGFGHRA
ncbi:MAG: helix-turn-helix domain-containing transcriptional regulator [Methylobacter sp.]